MDNQRSGVGDGLEEPLSQARQNTFGIIKALRENAGLDLRVTSKTGEEGHHRRRLGKIQWLLQNIRDNFH